MTKSPSDPTWTWHRIGRTICWVCAISWFLTGALYAWAGLVAPLDSRAEATASPERLAAFFALARGGASLYVAAFAMFALADFSLLLLASVLRELIGRGDFRAQVVYVSVTVSMLLGLLVDLLLLSNWLVIQSFSASLPFAAQAALWVVTLNVQAASVWMSAASFLLGGLGLLLVFSATRTMPDARRWSGMSLLFAGVVLLEVTAILSDVITGGSGVFTAVVFLAITNVVAPIWAISLARVLSSKPQEGR